MEPPGPGLPAMKAVTAAIIEQEGQVLLTRRSHGQIDAGRWEFPGGKQEPGETLAECLEREIMEELSVTVEAGSIVAETIYRSDRGAIRLVAMQATLVAGEIWLSVHDRWAWVEIARLLEDDLAPADVPIARKVMAGEMRRSETL